MSEEHPAPKSADASPKTIKIFLMRTVYQYRCRLGQTLLISDAEVLE
jgi:hypothetical protein